MDEALKDLEEVARIAHSLQAVVIAAQPRLNQNTQADVQAYVRALAGSAATAAAAIARTPGVLVLPE